MFREIYYSPGFIPMRPGHLKRRQTNVRTNTETYYYASLFRYRCWLFRSWRGDSSLGAKMRHSSVSRGAMESVACTFAVYTRLKGIHPDLWLRELKERRDALKEAKAGFRESRGMPCGHQDRAHDAYQWRAIQFLSTLEAMRMLKGRVSPRFQEATMEALGVCSGEGCNCRECVTTRFETIGEMRGVS